MRTDLLMCMPSRTQVEEFGAALKQLNIDLSQKDIETLFRTSDKDGSGLLEFDEFYNHFRKDLEVEGQTEDPFFWCKARPRPFISKGERKSLADAVFGDADAKQSSTPSAHELVPSPHALVVKRPPLLPDACATPTYTCTRHAPTSSSCGFHLPSLLLARFRPLAGESLINMIQQQVELREVKEAFNRFDENRNGRLDASELIRALKQLHVSVGETQALDLIELINRKSGVDMGKYVGFDAFVSAFTTGADLHITTNIERGKAHTREPSARSLTQHACARAHVRCARRRDGRSLRVLHLPPAAWAPRRPPRVTRAEGPILLPACAPCVRHHACSSRPRARHYRPPLGVEEHTRPGHAHVLLDDGSREGSHQGGQRAQGRRNQVRCGRLRLSLRHGRRRGQEW